MVGERGRPDAKEYPVDHVIRRARERYGLNIKLNHVRQMERDITEGKSVRVALLPYSTEKHLVKTCGVTVIAIWQAARGFIATLLPADDTTWRRHMEGKRKARKEHRLRRRAEDQREMEEGLA